MHKENKEVLRARYPDINSFNDSAAAKFIVFIARGNAHDSMQ